MLSRTSIPVADLPYIAFSLGPLGVGELILFGLVVLILFGAKRIPLIARSVARFPVEVMRGKRGSSDEDTLRRSK
ncbi:MAG: twin-arginine translocase TatA/TatE family subunit [Verrucomicrobiota bacterium]